MHANSVLTGASVYGRSFLIRFPQVCGQASPAAPLGDPHRARRPETRGREAWATSSVASVALRRLAGALHHQGLGLTDADRERIGKELTDGKAAMGVLTPFNESSMISAKLGELGGASEKHTVSNEALNAHNS